MNAALAPSAAGLEVSVARGSIDRAFPRIAEATTATQEQPRERLNHATTGAADLHCRVVARTNEHLQDVINGILGVSGIMRTTTQIALTEQLGHRVLPLVAQLAK